eukprot:SAG31_NODE_866_length_11370_cov_4.806761_12_plen_255_part_00
MRVTTLQAVINLEEVLTTDRVREKLVKDYEFNKKIVPQKAKDALAIARAAKAARADEAAVAALKVAATAKSSRATASSAAHGPGSASIADRIWPEADVSKVMDFLNLDRKSAIKRLEDTNLGTSGGHAAQKVITSMFGHDAAEVVDGIPVGVGNFSTADATLPQPTETWRQNMFGDNVGNTNATGMHGAGNVAIGGVTTRSHARRTFSEDAIANIMTITTCSRARAISALEAHAGNLELAVNDVLTQGSDFVSG